MLANILKIVAVCAVFIPWKLSVPGRQADIISDFLVVFLAFTAAQISINAIIGKKKK